MYISFAVRFFYFKDKGYMQKVSLLGAIRKEVI